MFRGTPEPWDAAGCSAYAGGGGWMGARSCVSEAGDVSKVGDALGQGGLGLGFFLFTYFYSLFCKASEAT